MKKLNKRNIIAAYARWLYLTKAWRTNKKIVVIESDDWGSIRTSTQEAYNQLSKAGYNLQKSPYTLDSLESNEDLTALYKVLNSVKDGQGNPACITANMIMANPNFEAIADNYYTEYIYETVDKTLEKYEGRDKVRTLWKDGMKSNLFYPQLHAKEHVRYWDWMKDLRNGETEALESFKHNMCGFPRTVSEKGKSYFHPPYVEDKILEEEGVDLNILITEGATFFKEEFGFKSKSTIAPNCGWTNSAEQVWKRNSIKYIQGGFFQEHHMKNNIKYYPHYLGENSKTKGLIYLVRNCTFEPSISSKTNYWKKTFKQVENAFSKNTPAIISSHRVNYIGSISIKNRENGLKQLEQLLASIIQKWPDTLFLNSKQLGDLIIESQTN